jgi:hypothetical protein
VVHVLVVYNVYHHCLRFDSGVVLVVVVILSTITVSGLTLETAMVDNITNQNMNHSSIKPQTVKVDNITTTA